MGIYLGCSDSPIVIIHAAVEFVSVVIISMTGYF